jgi:Fe2+ or Zn2+ uptake regulation protein
MSTDDGLLSHIEKDIERYLAQRPDAADTAEGISTWWLPSALGPDALPAVVAALRQLEARGVVVRLERSGGVTIYSSSSRRRGCGH